MKRTPLKRKTPIRKVNPDRALLAYLREKGFRCSCGPTKFYEKFNRTTEPR